MEENWYVIQVVSGQEEKMAALCRKVLPEPERTEVYVPYAERRFKKDGLWQREDRVLFGGYFFLITDQILEVYEALRKIQEFKRILKSDEEPARLLPEEISVIQSITSNKHRVRISRGIQYGKRTVILSGPLKGLEGKIVKVNRSKDTATLKLTIMGRDISAEVGLHLLG